MLAVTLMCLCVVVVVSRRNVPVATESRVEHEHDVKSLEGKISSQMVQVVREMARDRRRDLQRMAALRSETLEQLKREVEALKDMVEPEQDEGRVQALLRKGEAVDTKRHVVIPAVIHLTWKSARSLPGYASNNMKEWRRLNPGYKVVLHDDDAVDAYASRHFAEFAPYWPLLKPVQKADVFRYLVMWKEGGVYADVDVDPVKPVDEWMANGTKNTLHWRSANVIIGWEQITDRPDWQGFYATNLQLCQWAFASSPGHAMWRHVLDFILQFYKSGGHLKTKSVIRSTGPGIFSQAVKEFLKKEHGAAIGEAPLTLQELKRKNLHVGDVLVLQQAALGGGDSWQGPDDVVLVRHSFAGSWKTTPPAGKSAEGEEKLDTYAGSMEKKMAEMKSELKRLKKEMESERKRTEGRAADDIAAADDGKPWWQATNDMNSAFDTSAEEQKPWKRKKEAETMLRDAAANSRPGDAGDGDESGDRKKFLIERLRMKGAAPIDTAAIDRMEEQEKHDQHAKSDVGAEKDTAKQASSTRSKTRTPEKKGSLGVQPPRVASPRSRYVSRKKRPFGRAANA